MYDLINVHTMFNMNTLCSCDKNIHATVANDAFLIKTYALIRIQYLPYTFFFENKKHDNNMYVPTYTYVVGD